MGPRSCERGNQTLHSVRASKLYCFNGAALVRARKCRTSGLASCRSWLQWGRARASAEIALLHALSDAQNKGFNGAALVRARKWRSRNLRTRRPVGLQWGRARASAEISAHRGVIPRDADLLQWGRARASAEIGLSSVAACCTCTSFNGAALVRARKSACTAPGAGGASRFNGAALVRARKCYIFGFNQPCAP